MVELGFELQSSDKGRDCSCHHYLSPNFYEHTEHLGVLLSADSNSTQLGWSLASTFPKELLGDTDAETQGPHTETALDCISVLTTETRVTVLQAPAAA